ncbi:MAG: serine/threonine-protein kinase [Propionicimonas sp.]|uniref:serine/threonine-protein kinase n=1 Tax=Propionicimonas sp. TaxID=1955623 RepID=UPI003D0B478F
MVGFPEIGDLIGAYRVDAEVGRGGMGIVYRATQVGLDRPVALKILDPRLATEPDFVARFSREASILASLDSPHIVQIFDHGNVDGCLYLAMQYVAGGDLSGLIGRTGALPPQTALKIFGQVLEALQDAHSRGIVHRDVKPSNVLLRPGEAEPFAYLCDFGIAQANDSHHTRTGMVAGSWAFLSPERQSGRPATPASDLYSAACVLWAMLTSRNVYSGTDVQVAMAHLNAPVAQLPGSDPLVVALNRLFWSCLAKDPAERPETAAEALRLAATPLALADGVGPLDISRPDSGIFRPHAAAPPQTLTPSEPAAAPPPPQRRRRGAWLIGVGALVVAALVLATTLSLGAGRSAPTATPTPGSSPSAAVVCWNAVPVDDQEQCGPPHGTEGLRWVYLSLVDQWDSCVNKAYRSTTVDYDCSLPGGVLRYRYWEDSDEAQRHYTGKYEDADATPLVLDGHTVGTIYRSDKRSSGVYTLSALWLDGHFSFSAEASTIAGRDALLDLVRLRAWDQLTGSAAGAAPAEGQLG